MDLLLISARVAASFTAGRVQDVVKKYKDILDEDTVRGWAEFDPTPTKKYLPWIADQVVQGVTIEDVGDAVEAFHKAQGRLPEKDLGKYGYDELKKALVGLPMSKREQRESEKSGGSKTVWSDDEWKLVRLDSHEAARLFGAGTRWCITERNPAKWDLYAEDTVIFAVIGKGKKFAWVVGPHDEEFRDSADEEIGQDEMVHELGIDAFNAMRDAVDDSVMEKRGGV